MIPSSLRELLMLFCYHLLLMVIVVTTGAEMWSALAVTTRCHDLLSRLVTTFSAIIGGFRLISTFYRFRDRNAKFESDSEIFWTTALHFLLMIWRNEECLSTFSTNIILPLIRLVILEETAQNFDRSVCWIATFSCQAKYWLADCWTVYYTVRLLYVNAVSKYLIHE